MGLSMSQREIVMCSNIYGMVHIHFKVHKDGTQSLMKPCDHRLLQMPQIWFTPSDESV